MSNVIGDALHLACKVTMEGVYAISHSLGGNPSNDTTKTSEKGTPKESMNQSSNEKVNPSSIQFITLHPDYKPNQNKIVAIENVQDFFNQTVKFLEAEVSEITRTSENLNQLSNDKIKLQCQKEEAEALLIQNQLQAQELDKELSKDSKSMTLIALDPFQNTIELQQKISLLNASIKEKETAICNLTSRKEKATEKYEELRKKAMELSDQKKNLVNQLHDELVQKNSSDENLLQTIRIQALKALTITSDFKPVDLSPSDE